LQYVAAVNVAALRWWTHNPYVFRLLTEFWCFLLNFRDFMCAQYL
jgi:hypothetical protein